MTLRDGEQQAGVELNADEKVAIAEALAEAGVQRIEAGLPAVSPQDAEAVARIAVRGLGARIFAFSRCMVDDVKRALDCGVQAIVMEVPSSEHIIEYGYRWSLRARDRADRRVDQLRPRARPAGCRSSRSTRRARTSRTFLDMIERVAPRGTWTR